MNSTALIFNFLRGRDSVTPHLRRISTAAMAASRQLRFVGQMTGVIWLSAAGAIGGAASAAVAFTSALAPLAGALGALPALLFATAGGLSAVIMGFSGIGAAMKTTTGAGRAADTLAAAEKRVEQAQKAALKAQQAVNDARAEAVRRLADVTRELARARLDEESAVLGVKEARERLAEARSSGDRDEIQRASIAYREAQFAVEDIRLRVQDLAAEESDRTTKGVEGSDEVTAATERHAEALENVAEAQAALNRAMSGGGGTSKAAQAYAKLSAEGKRLVDVLKAIGPAWARVRQAVQSAVLAGVAEDVRLLSGAYLPVMLRQLPAIGQGWNNAFRGSMQVASTAGFVADINTSLGHSATLWQRVGSSFGLFLDGFRHWIAVGSEFLPRLGSWVQGMAKRFQEWSVKVRETGQAHDWIQRALDVGHQFNQLLGAWSASLVTIFSLGADPTFLTDLIAGSQAFRDWLSTAQGQERITAMFAEFRAVGSAAWEALKTGIDVLSQLDLGGVTASFTILGAVLKVVADNMGLINAILPVLIPLYVIHKTNVTVLRIAYSLWGSVVAVTTFYVKILGGVLQFASAALGRHTAATFAGRAGALLHAAATWVQTAALRAYVAVTTITTATIRAAATSTMAWVAATRANIVAATMSAVAWVRATAAMIATRTAVIAATAAQWLMAPATWAALGPILLIVLAIAALIVVIVLIIKYHKEIGAFFVMIWGHIWDFLKMIGAWFAGPFVDFFVGAWNYIVNLFNGGVTWVMGWVNRFLAPILAIKDHIQQVGIWQTLVDGFKGAINVLIALWNRLDFSIGPFTLPAWIPGLGGKQLYIPDIFPDLPHLDVGGHVTRDGAAIIHKGETVVPAAETTPFRGGGGTAPRGRLTIGSDGSSTGRALVELIRGAVRDMGGDFDIVFEA